MGLRVGAGATALWLVVAGCAGTPAPDAPPSAAPSAKQSPPSVATPSASATLPPSASPIGPSATPIALPSPAPEGTGLPPQIGLPSEACVEGWQSPSAGSAVHDEGIGMLHLEMGLTSPLEVVDIRFFAGPDVPWIIEPHYPIVERWYIKARLPADATFAGRWLLERRSPDVRGVSAVAPFDSTGYESPDWMGFVGDGPPRDYPGLPGQWAGLAYDFVTGEGDSGQPGLPDQVAGCLDGS